MSGVANLKPRGLWYEMSHLNSGPSSGNRIWVIEPNGFLNLNPHRARGTRPPRSVTTRPIPGADSSFGVKLIVLTPLSFVRPLARLPGRSDGGARAGQRLPRDVLSDPGDVHAADALLLRHLEAHFGEAFRVLRAQHLVVDGLHAEVHGASLAGKPASGRTRSPDSTAAPI